MFLAGLVGALEHHTDVLADLNKLPRQGVDVVSQHADAALSADVAGLLIDAVDASEVGRLSAARRAN